MATDIERLSVLIEANTKSYERAMARIEQRTDRAIRASSKSVKSLDAALTGAMATAGRFATAFGAGALAGGLSQVPGAIRGVVAEVAKLGDTADKIGITSERLQELNYQAQQNGSSSEQMASALEQFSKRIGEAAQKGGPLADILAANNVALRDSAGNLRPINDLLSDYANLIQGASSASDQFVLATQAFGRGAGADMVLVLKSGADGMRQFAADAQRTGQIIAGDLVQQAQAIDDKFDQLTGTLAVFAQSQVLIFVAQLNAVMGTLSGWLDKIRETTSNSALQQLGAGAEYAASRIPEVSKELQLAEDYLAAVLAQSEQGLIDPGTLNAAVQGANILRNELAALQAQAAQTAASVQSAAAGLSGASARYGGPPKTVLPSKVTDFTGNLPKVRPNSENVLPPLAGFGGGGSRGGGGGSSIASEAQRDKEAVIELIAELERERDLIGATEAQKRISNELRQAGAAATDEQKARIESLVNAIEQENAAQDALSETMDQARDLGAGALSSFTDAIRNGEGAAGGLKSALDSVLDTVIRIGEQAAISAVFGQSGTSGGGLLGSLLGSLLGGSKPFGGLFAEGGTLGAGKWGIAGEKGPEIIQGPATIHPLRGANSNSRSPVNLNINVSGARGNQEIMEMVAQGVGAGLEEYDRTAPARIGPRLAARQARGFG